MAGCKRKCPCNTATPSLSDSSAVGIKLAFREAEWKKENFFGKMKIDVEYPTTNNAVAKKICEYILTTLDSLYAFHHGIEGDHGRKFEPFEGNHTNIDAAVEYYGNKAFTAWADNERQRYENDKGIGEETGPAYYCFEHIFEIDKEFENNALVAFDFMTYSYMGGGLHGLEGGKGYVTFDKSNGNIVEQFILPGSAPAMQDLIRLGLCAYLSEAGTIVAGEDLEDHLFLEGNTIPLPQKPPCPEKEGLEFRYDEYEIAPYAYGRPEFTIPYADLKPYLTNEAKELLGL